MPQRLILLIALGVVVLIAIPAWAQVDTIQYFEKYEYPIFKEMEAKTDSLKALRDSVTAQIHKRQKEQKEKVKKLKTVILLNFDRITKPESPEVFTTAFHFPPVAQYLTNTCWSYSGTSFLESEVARLTGKKIKLSEMHTVYYEFLEKARRYVAERGESEFGEGSEGNANTRILKTYGAMPLAAYPGLADTTDVRHNHEQMFEELSNYIHFIRDHEYWDETEVLGGIKVILNKYMGAPPQSFVFEGKTYTPVEFARNVLKLNPDDYVDLMSTLSAPFWTQAEFKVPDNWWHDSSYYNVPLDVWYQTLKKAISSGYTACIGGDVSEPGKNGFEDAAAIPDYDIPQNYINQHSREFRIYNGTTADDHGIHLVGYKKVGGRDWYLIKDSGSSARYGKFKGYYFFRDDFIRLKMLGYTVHKDMIKDLLPKFAQK